MQKLSSNLALLLCSLLLCATVGEVVSRYYYYGWAGFSHTAINSTYGIHRQNLVQASPVEGLLYELKSDSDAYNKAVPHQTNAQGLRDKEYPLEKPANTFRVAVIGDSSTLPEGVKIENAYHSLLEERMNEEQDDVTYEFINFGVPGYDPTDYETVIRSKALAYNPDLVLVAFSPRNDYEPRPPLWKFKVYTEPLEDRFFQLYVLKLLREEFPIFGKNHLSPGWNKKIEFDADGQYIAESFAAIAATAKHHQVPVVLAVLDFIPTHKELRRIIQQDAAAQGMHVVDLSDSFAGNHKKYWIYPTDSHPNAKANRIFAEVLYDFIVKEGLVKP